MKKKFLNGWKWLLSLCVHGFAFQGNNQKESKLAKQNSFFFEIHITNEFFPFPHATIEFSVFGFGSTIPYF